MRAIEVGVVIAAIGTAATAPRRKEDAGTVIAATGKSETARAE